MNTANRLLLFGCAVLLFSTGPLVSSQTEKSLSSESEKKDDIPVLTLDEVIRHSLKASPEIRKIDAELADKLASATEAQVPQNPEVQFDAIQSGTHVGDLNRPRFNVEISQPIRLSHFGIRQTYASALKQTANLERQADLVRALNETVLLYYRLWALQKREELFANSEKQAQEVAQRIQESLKLKEIPSNEGNLFMAEALRFGVELKATQAELAQAQIEMLRLTGLSHKNFKVQQPNLAPIPEDTFKLMQFASNRANLRELVLARQRTAQRLYDIARLDIFPELTPRFLYERSANSNEREWGVGIAVKIPLWDWNQAANKRSKAQKDLAESEAEVFDRVTLDQIIETRQKRAQALQKKSDAYWNVVLPAYQESFKTAHRMFEEGQANMIQLWQIQQRLTDLQEKALQEIVNSLTARTLLEQAIGGKIEEIPEESKQKPSL